MSDKPARQGTDTPSSGRARDEAPAEVARQRSPSAVTPNRRSGKTIELILESTIELLMDMGATKLSIRSVCDAAGISRGTLYRYFATKDELLTAVALHIRTRTDRVLNAMAEIADPEERFDVFLETMVHGEFRTKESMRLLEVEPMFVTRYYRDNFAHFIQRVKLALEPVYDSWELELDAKIDRELMSELYVRFALSRMLVPTDEGDTHLAGRLKALALQLSNKVALES